ncbi:MAG: DNA polymerase III subunit delta [Luminiphilus sp.]|jgi:DNA polymerase III subunit delta|nr:DNA polymerase III subunit delta [Luminiphilus sp.]
MQLKPEQLETHLAGTLATCYLISGDEPLLAQESADAIRQAARASGCNERQRIHIANKDDWLTLGHSAGSLSLFSDRKLIEVFLPTGKPGAEGSRALQEYLTGESEDVLLIVSGRIDKQSQKSKWYSALDRAGVVVPIWPVSPAELPAWIAARMKTAGLSGEREAVALLAERMEGNLLAAAQEIEKLRLLHGEQRITADMIADTVSDNARYDAFRLVDVALSGDARGALRTLRGLRAEAIQPPVLLWAVAREVRLLADLKRDVADGTPINSALTQRGVWRSRQAMVRSATQRLSGRDLAEMQALSFQADGASKGFLAGEPWSLLESLMVVMAQGLPVDSRSERLA